MAFNFAYRSITADNTLKLSPNGGTTVKTFTGNTVIDEVSCYNSDGTGTSTGWIAIGLYKSGSPYTETYMLNNSTKQIGNIISDGYAIEIYNGTLKAIQCSATYHPASDDLGKWSQEQWHETTQTTLMFVGVLAMLVCYSIPYFIVYKMYQVISANKEKKGEQPKK